MGGSKMTEAVNKVTDLETELYQVVCEEWKKAIIELKEKEAVVAKLRSMIIDVAGGERMEFGVKVTHVVTNGKTNYRAIVEELGVDQDIIERHTGMPESNWRVTKY